MKHKFDLASEVLSLREIWVFWLLSLRKSAQKTPDVRMKGSMDEFNALFAPCLLFECTWIFEGSLLEFEFFPWLLSLLEFEIFFPKNQFFFDRLRQKNCFRPWRCTGYAILTWFCHNSCTISNDRNQRDNLSHKWGQTFDRAGFKAKKRGTSF